MAVDNSLHSGGYFLSTVTPYTNKLLRLNVEHKINPRSTIHIPCDYKDILPRVVKAKWKTHSIAECANGSDDVIESDIRLRVVPIVSRKWGEDAWQWQTCVSSGGILNVLTNYDSNLSTPMENDTEYILDLTFLVA